jgi:hypothetical protein
MHVNFLQWSSGRFFCLKKREILEFAINKEESSDINKREISLVCENNPYFKKNLWKYGCKKGESPAKSEFTCMHELTNLGVPGPILKQAEIDLCHLV